METERDRETLSPELALVCPELAARARAALPARPWEAFAPPRPPLRLVPGPPATAPAIEAPVASLPRRRDRRPSRTSMVGVLLAVALVVTGLLPARDAPTLRRQIQPSLIEPLQPGPHSFAAGKGKATFTVVEGEDALAGLAPPTPCLPAGATLGTPIARDGTFELVLPVGAAEVELTGRVERGRVTGSYRVRGPGCDSGRVPFAAEP